MTLKEIEQVGNDGTTQLCQALLDRFGPGNTYEYAIGSAATTLLFHVFRLALPRSKAEAIKLLQVILDDVAHNVVETSKDKIKFTVA